MKSNNNSGLYQVHAESLYTPVSASAHTDTSQVSFSNNILNHSTNRKGFYQLAELLGHSFSDREQMITIGESEFFTLAHFFPPSTTPKQMFDYLKHGISQSASNQISIF